MKLKWIPAVAAVVCFAFPTVAFAAEGADIFKANKCNSCHSVKAEGIKIAGTPDEEAPDLSKVGKSHDKKWIAGYVLKKVKKDDKKHPAKKFKGSGDELKAMATWLGSLK